VRARRTRSIKAVVSGMGAISNSAARRVRSASYGRKAAVLLTAVISERANLPSSLVQAGPLALQLNLLALGMGWVSARLLRLPAPPRGRHCPGDGYSECTGSADHRRHAAGQYGHEHPCRYLRRTDVADGVTVGLGGAFLIQFGPAALAIQTNIVDKLFCW